MRPQHQERQLSCQGRKREWRAVPAIASFSMKQRQLPWMSKRADNGERLKLIVQWKNLAESTLTKESRFTSPVTRQSNIVHLVFYTKKGTSSLLCYLLFLSKYNISMQLQKTQTEEHASKQQTSILEKCQGHGRKGKTEGRHRLEKTIWIQCGVILKQKRTLGKTSEISIRFVV